MNQLIHILIEIGAILIVLFSISINFAYSNSSFSECEKRNPNQSNSIIKLRCPEERIWFGSGFNILTPSSNSDKRYCCGNIENRYCCKKSEKKKEIYIKQRSEYSTMSSLGSSIFSLIFFAIVMCIICKCLGACFRKKRLNQGVVITTQPGTTVTRTINGQNIHVINQPAQPQQFNNPYSQPNQYPPPNYPPTSYAPTNQYPPVNPYPSQYPPVDYNQPPPAYTPSPIYPPAIKTDNNQTSANDKNQPAPSAPDL